jgi:hypothetical protein
VFEISETDDESDNVTDEDDDEEKSEELEVTATCSCEVVKTEYLVVEIEPDAKYGNVVDVLATEFDVYS